MLSCKIETFNFLHLILFQGFSRGTRISFHSSIQAADNFLLNPFQHLNSSNYILAINPLGIYCTRVGLKRIG